MPRELKPRDLKKLGATYFRWPSGVAWPSALVDRLALTNNIKIQDAPDPFGEGDLRFVGLKIQQEGKEVFVSDCSAHDPLRIQLFAGPIGRNWTLFKLVADHLLALGAVPLDEALSRYEAAVLRWPPRS